VATGKLACVEPDVTRTLAGVMATRGLSLASRMTSPPVGAGLLSVTVPAAVVPPGTLCGSTPREASGDGRTTSVALAGEWSSVAVNVTVAAAAVGRVAMRKLLRAVPAPTPIVAGMVARFGSLLVRVMRRPEFGAGAFSTTAPAAGSPPMTEGCPRVRLTVYCGSRYNVADRTWSR
jgi:hypothetical protein